MKVWLLIPALLLGAAGAQVARPLNTQDPRYPLVTRVTSGQVLAFYAAFPQGLTAELNTKAVAAQRQVVLPLARAGDPLAQYLVGQTFDLFEYGKGTPQDARIAMEWYRRAADQHFATAEQLLSQVYTYSLLGQPRNLTWAGNYLQRAYVHGSADIKADSLIEMARQSDPTRDAGDLRYPGFSASRKQTRQYLVNALKYRPDDTTALDWLGTLAAEDGEFRQAVAYAERSDNLMGWIEAGRWLQTGKPGLPADPTRALALFRRAMTVMRRGSDYESEMYTVHMGLFEMECQGALRRAQFADLVTPESERLYRQNRQGCLVPPGG